MLKRITKGDSILMWVDEVGDMAKPTYDELVNILVIEGVLRSDNSWESRRWCTKPRYKGEPT